MDLSAITSLFSGIPWLYAFVIGVVIAINPCNMGVNIAGIAYLSLKLDSPRQTLLSGTVYTLGRALTYSIFGLLIFLFGASIAEAAPVIQSYENMILGSALILIGVVMLELVKPNISIGVGLKDKYGLNLSEKGLLGSLGMGAISSLAFCPCTAIVFFGLLMPLAIQSNLAGMGFPVLFGLGTGVPVLAFAALMGMSTKVAQSYINGILKFEPYVRTAFGLGFVTYGLYLLATFLAKIVSAP